ncbi:MAG: fructose-6-phosphate aldolase [Gemmatimonadetes bacterium]|nr:fructose-6-phosphate aldolase [Gemmatimonadota bacterium]
MQLFLDSASLKDVREGMGLGLVDGVTTNPSLIAKERDASRPADARRHYRERLKEICALCPGPISAETVGTTATEMMREAEEYAAIAENIVVKVVLTAEGLRAVRECAARGIRTNVTLCFSATQALLAARAGADYVSPFVGRVDDVSGDGMALIRDIATIFENYNFATHILVASVRHPRHVLEAALIGADVATAPLAILKQLLAHPLTDKGVAAFLKDWEGA